MYVCDIFAIYLRYITFVDDGPWPKAQTNATDVPPGKGKGKSNNFKYENDEQVAAKSERGISTWGVVGIVSVGVVVVAAVAVFVPFYYRHTRNEETIRLL